MADGRRKRYSLNVVVSPSPSERRFSGMDFTEASGTSPWNSPFGGGSTESFHFDKSNRNSRHSFYRTLSSSNSLSGGSVYRNSSVGLGLSSSAYMNDVMCSRESLSMSVIESNAANIKVLFIGDAGVGKTAMILNYCRELPTRAQWEHIIGLSPTPNRAGSSNRSGRNQMVRRSLTARAYERKSDIMQEQRKRYSSTDYDDYKENDFMAQRDFKIVKDVESESSSLNYDPEELIVDTKTTIGVDIKTNIINIDNRIFNCILWDTAGQERYRNAIMPSLYKKSNAIILSYDITDKCSFKNSYEHWLVEAMGHFAARDYEKARFYFIGNKTDLYKQREVTHEDVIAAIEEIESRYGLVIAGNFEVTCKNFDSLNEAMNNITVDLVNNGCYEEKAEQELEGTAVLEEDEEMKESTTLNEQYDDEVVSTSNDEDSGEDSDGSLEPVIRKRTTAKTRIIDISKPKNQPNILDTSHKVSCCT